ncbi:MAG: hypothetical protein ACYS8K_08760, partial [Planctomycetota bacterium]
MWHSPQSRNAPPAGELPPQTAGQKVCIALALLMVAGAATTLVLSCCRHRRPPVTVPLLPPAPERIGAPPPRIPVLVERSRLGLAVRAPGRGAWYGPEQGGRRVAAVGAGPWL